MIRSSSLTQKIISKTSPQATGQPPLHIYTHKNPYEIFCFQLTRNRSKDVRNENLHQSLVHHMITVTHPFQNRLIFAQSNQLCFWKSTFYFTQIAGVNKCSKWINENAFAEDKKQQLLLKLLFNKVTDGSTTVNRTLDLVSHETGLEKCFHRTALAHKLCRGMNDRFVLKELEKTLWKHTFTVVG